jgi:hypothetical protein
MASKQSVTLPGLPTRKSENKLDRKSSSLSKVGVSDGDFFQRNDANWEFVESYLSNEITKAALEDNSNSIQGPNLDRYLKQVAGRVFQEQDKMKLPEPFDELVSFQCKNGKWEDYGRVLKCLKLPPAFKLADTVPWEAATALVVAAIRQNSENFDLLRDYHDRAIAWISDKGIIRKAMEAMAMCALYNDYHDEESDENVGKEQFFGNLSQQYSTGRFAFTGQLDYIGNSTSSNVEDSADDVEFLPAIQLANTDTFTLSSAAVSGRATPVGDDTNSRQGLKSRERNKGGKSPNRTVGFAEEQNTVVFHTPTRDDRKTAAADIEQQGGEGAVLSQEKSFHTARAITPPRFDFNAFTKAEDRVHTLTVRNILNT